MPRRPDRSPEQKCMEDIIASQCRCLAMLDQLLPEIEHPEVRRMFRQERRRLQSFLAEARATLVGKRRCYPNEKDV